MSEIQKVLNLIRGGEGGRKFSKISEIQKVPNYPRGGGSSLIGNFSQIFPFFFSDASPKMIRSTLQNQVDLTKLVTSRQLVQDSLINLAKIELIRTS